jgi:hypothetical protein
MNRIQSLARKLRFPLREIHVIPGESRIGHSDA